MCSQGRTKTKMQNSAYETCTGVPLYSYFSKERQSTCKTCRGVPLVRPLRDNPACETCSVVSQFFVQAIPTLHHFRTYNEGGLNRFFALSASFPLEVCPVQRFLCYVYFGLSPPTVNPPPPHFDSLEVISAKILHSTGIVTAKVWRPS